MLGVGLGLTRQGRARAAIPGQANAYSTVQLMSVAALSAAAVAMSALALSSVAALASPGLVANSTLALGSTATLDAPVTRKFTMEGDSITYGVNLATADSWPSKFGALTGYAFNNIGESGYLLADMDANFNSRAGASYEAGKVNEAFLLGGPNDLIYNNATASQLQGWVTSFAGKAKAKGFSKVWVGTIMDGALKPGTNTWYTQDNLDQLHAFNAWLRANYTSAGIDGVVDYATRPGLTDPTSTTYFQDGLHPTAVGTTIMANAAVAARRGPLSATSTLGIFSTATLSAAAASTPADILGPAYFFEGDLAGLAASSGTMTGWTNKKSGGVNASPIGSITPPVTTDGMIVSGDNGASLTVSLPTGTLLYGWIVAKSTSVSTFGRLISASDGSFDAFSGGVIPLVLNSAGDSFMSYQNGHSCDPVPITLNEWFAAGGYFLTATTMQVSKNGVESAGAAGSPVDVSTVTITVITIGCRGGAAEGFHGAIRNVVLATAPASAPLTATQLSQMNAWAANARPNAAAGQPVGLLLAITKAS